LVCSIDIFCCTGADLLISVIGRVVRRSTAVWSQKCLVACMYTVNTDHTCSVTQDDASHLLIGILRRNRRKEGVIIIVRENSGVGVDDLWRRLVVVRW